MRDAEKLLKVCAENPDLEIMAMVNYEVVNGDEYSSWLGSFSDATVHEYTEYEMYDVFRIVYREDSDEIIEHLQCMNEELSYLDAEEIVENLGWKKAIFVYIDTPN